MIRLGASWWYIDKTYFPKPVRPTPPEFAQPESVQALAGVAATVRAPAKIVETPKPTPVAPAVPGEVVSRLALRATLMRAS